MKTNIIIPMAGLGSRFANAGYKIPKPLINVFGSTMLESVIDNINHKDVKFIFVLNKQEAYLPQIENIILKKLSGAIIVYVEDLTEGSACTALAASDYINNDGLIIINCDQIIKDYNFDNLITFAKTNNADGILGTFLSSSNKNSYAQLDCNGRIIDIKEKIVISNIASNGLHFWKCGYDFIESANQMIAAKEKYNNEFYVAPSYNYMIKKGKIILPYFFNLHFPIGTPEDLNRYLDIQ